MLTYFTRSRAATFGTVILVIMILMGVLASVLTDKSPTASDFDTWLPPSLKHPLGTTALGQDIFAQILHGARLSLFIGFMAGTIATMLSTVIGLTSAYAGGRVDDVLSTLTNIMLVIPGLPLLIVASAFIGGQGVWPIILVIGLTGWPWGARVLRSQALGLRSRDYVTAAVGIGESSLRIVFVELLPNMAGLIAATFFGASLYAVLSEAALSFIGVGDVGQVTWGTMLYWAQARGALLQGAWWWIAVPGILIALLGTSFALINFAIDAISNPRLASLSIPPAPRAKTPVHAFADDAVFETVDLRAGYLTHSGPVEAVRGVSLTIAPGEIVGIAGESGCGKSTLAFAATRLLEFPGTVFSGDSAVGGRSIGAMSDQELRATRWRDVSFVFQASMNSLNPVLRMREQLTDALEAHGVTDKKERHARALELLRTVGIDERFIDAYPHELSGGMKQRMVIAMAIALRPKLIFMDEPTTALDVIVQRQIVDEIRKLRAEFGVSIAMITHDLSLLLEICDRIVVMYAGQVVEVASPAQMRNGPAHPYSRSLLSAFPPIDGPRERRSGLAGRPPSLAAALVGCPFFDRCAIRTPGKCEQIMPLLTQDQHGRQVACHNAPVALQELAHA